MEVNLVATDALLEKKFGELPAHRVNAVPGIRSAPFDFDPAQCRSSLSRWLAENIKTTRFDDDLSILHIQLQQTEEGLHFRALGEKLLKANPTSETQSIELLSSLEKWIETRKKYHAAYGDACFEKRTVQFAWPVIGSHAVGGVEEPAAYFDLCAAQIKAMSPVSVYTRGGGVCPLKFYQAAQ